MSTTTESNGKPVLFSTLRAIGAWLHRTAGIDRAIAYTILARGWASAAGLVTLALIARFLSPAEQGYYYTFGSLIALQIVFELGFSFVILQMASHERAHLEIHSDGSISGDPVCHARLASVLQKTVRWYSSAAILLMAGLLTAGFHFFRVHSQAGPGVHWQAPWVADVLAATCTFMLDPLLSFMEGAGFVAKVAHIRFLQAAIGSLFAWTALLLHHGLFAPAATIAGTASVAAIWLFSRRRLLLPLLKFNPGEHRIGWMSEVWHFQWRIAISWLCGYFIFQLYNPVLFAYRGPVEAGRMGMSLSLASALNSVAISWINTKAAPFGALISRRQFSELDHTFFRSTRQALGVCVLGAASVWALDVLLNMYHLPFANRILSPLPLAVLLINTCINIVIFAQAVYLRAHKQEKFLLNSVLGAILVGSSTYFLGSRYGAIGVVTGSLAVGLLMGLPLGTYTFSKYRRLWHAQ
jgi:O-antigen/teichoic acid export membrane protein